MSTEIRYVMADTSDRSAIMRVDDDLFDSHVNPDLLTEFLEDPRHHLALAYCGRDVVGMASGFVYIHPDKPSMMFINEVAVVVEHRNLGIGRNLVKTLCNHGRVLGCGDAWIATESSNLPAQKSFVVTGGTEERDDVTLITYDLESKPE